MSNAEERKQAASFHASKRKSTIHGTTDLIVRDSRIQEEMTFYKEKLTKAIKDKEIAVAESCLDKLMGLRTKQLAFSVAKLKQTGRSLDSKASQKLLLGYQEDCIALVYSVKTLLS
ncbi:MAG: hypothetical protein HYY51_01440 [Candidatus Magasanikbacteria bacterium]|nr:hypothetical protein [Candidatus Magasanikbacteria bacterium]